MWTAVLYDADQGYPYVKRFAFEPTNKRTRFLGDNEKSELILLSDTSGCRLEVTFGGDDAFRGAQVVDVEDFIGVKSFRAKGKRLTTFTMERVVEIEPKPVPEESEVIDDSSDDNDSPEEIEPDRSDDEVRDEINGQQRIF